MMITNEPKCGDKDCGLCYPEFYIERPAPRPTPLWFDVFLVALFLSACLAIATIHYRTAPVIEAIRQARAAGY